MRIILVRHGQTAWNEKQVVRGRGGIPLDETGIRQAHALAERLVSFNIETIYSGPLQQG
ncbi:MAG TPA: histidine phosphatase family protein [Candidatus Omnitrophota bacterium]|jgi:broad specificity phosphatase PhoE|nr:histidine phosphatase family protein [Candidatus Omnitrophota bacterium]HPN55881.1 histidine phosphatase family protein [Candidatus Omnitrophota bacterium]